MQIFDPAGHVLTFFGSAGNFPGAMNLPAGLALHEGDLDLFADRIHPAFQAERLVVVTNQFGPNKVSVYALGHLKPGKTARDVAAGRVSVQEASTSQPASAPWAVQPDTAPEDSAATAPASGPATPASSPAGPAPQG